jgi:hypothetical protein
LASAAEIVMAVMALTTEAIAEMTAIHHCRRQLNGPEV